MNRETVMATLALYESMIADGTINEFTEDTSAELERAYDLRVEMKDGFDEARTGLSAANAGFIATFEALEPVPEEPEDGGDDGGAEEPVVDDRKVEMAEKTLMPKIDKPVKIPYTWPGTVDELEFWSANPAICAVTSDGVLLAKSRGTTVIKITAKPNGSFYAFAVSVVA